MALETPSQREYEEAIRFFRELEKDPVKAAEWWDKTLDMALEGWYGGRRRQGRPKKR